MSKPTTHELRVEAIRASSCTCNGPPVRTVEDGLSLNRCANCGRVQLRDPDKPYTPPRPRSVP